MERLKNKSYAQYDYTSRYTGVPYYYDAEDGKEVYGLSGNMLKDLPWVAHEAKQGDTWDSLALNYYNNPTFWWILTYFNDVQDAFEPIFGKRKIVKIPSLTSIEFGDLR